MVFESRRQIKLLVLFIVCINITGLIYYMYTKSRYLSTHCGDIDYIYNDIGKVSNFNVDAPENKGLMLRDFYVKTAYNCCAIGGFKNTYVSNCALKQVLRQGARCLDFEIYSVDNEPVIAVSSLSDYNFKQSFNSIPVMEALQIIQQYGFSGGTCPNPDDPLIVHLRLKTTHKDTITAISKAILATVQSRLLGKEYSFEYQGNNLGSVTMDKLMGKVIIAVDKTNKQFENTDLDEYVNICSNSMFMRALRNYNVKYTPDMNELIDYNKKQMTLTMPDLGPNDTNSPASLHMKYGCQFVGMCYQNYDSNMEFYESFFAEQNSAFVLKPEHLRYEVVKIKVPPPQNKDLSYAPRNVKSDYYDFTI
jgi:hypothetical protein